MYNSLISTAVALVGLAAAHPGHSKRALTAGKIYSSCTVKGVVALTFDDGPMDYTLDLLGQLEAAGHKATFFQNGDNYGYIYDYNSTLQAQIAGGHQLCSHTLVYHI
jgi:peptidoglycan/xylan/chitin deacetylase (PgdA/CDA1 family)